MPIMGSTTREIVYPNWHSATAASKRMRKFISILGFTNVADFASLSAQCHSGVPFLWPSLFRPNRSATTTENIYFSFKVFLLRGDVIELSVWRKPHLHRIPVDEKNQTKTFFPSVSASLEKKLTCCVGVKLFPGSIESLLAAYTCRYMVNSFCAFCIENIMLGAFS